MLRTSRRSSRLALEVKFEMTASVFSAARGSALPSLLCQPPHLTTPCYVLCACVPPSAEFLQLLTSQSNQRAIAEKEGKKKGKQGGATIIITEAHVAHALEQLGFGQFATAMYGEGGGGDGGGNGSSSSSGAAVDGGGSGGGGGNGGGRSGGGTAAALAAPPPAQSKGRKSKKQKGNPSGLSDEVGVQVSRTRALPRLALPCLASPRLALPCLAWPCLALPCLADTCTCSQSFSRHRQHHSRALALSRATLSGAEAAFAEAVCRGCSCAAKAAGAG